MPYLSHHGSGRFDNTVAMNLPNQEIAKLRDRIAKHTGLDLTFFKGWNPAGEAHVTVVTPLELHDVLLKHLTMAQIDAIAMLHDIQASDLGILGLGHGGSPSQENGETFFVIVDSKKLRRIRNAIQEAFIEAGGNPTAFDPTLFYPHITVGFTKRDLHLADGVIKNLQNSRDPRFVVILK